jgi:predicted site-specific integrase-resolvase
MKLSHWAKENGIKYKTAYHWIKNNKMPVPFSQTPTGTILVHPNKNNNTKNNVYIYTRVLTN